MAGGVAIGHATAQAGAAGVTDVTNDPAPTKSSKLSGLALVLIAPHGSRLAWRLVA